ncbi:MAG TPA: carboxypeptidase regulatory-like domain-containing protein [Candidatus Acidoferrales bacterium]|nr:carboxypeptidase regulatory-like domain-containing protein [Candidatus Acidoferrales bacterium]
MEMQTTRYAKLIATILTGAAVLLVRPPSAVSGYSSRGFPSALPLQGAYTVQPAPGGTIAGKITYGGKPVKPRKVAVTQDMAACGNSQEMLPVRVEQGGVADAVVWIDDVTHGKAFAFPKAVLSQKHCTFTPHVVLMAPGQLEVDNDDQATHNVHIYARYNRESNEVMAPGASPLDITLMRPETVQVGCDVHTWMKGYIVVAKNPYYTLSQAGGAFELTNVPAGTYHLKVWQENLGTKDQAVTVQAGHTATVNFTLGS